MVLMVLVDLQIAFYEFRNLIWGMLTILSKETIWVIILVRLTSSSVIISYM